MPQDHGKRNLGQPPNVSLWQRLKPVAREMRKQPTDAEETMWQRLRRGRLRGFKFRRQYAIGRFIVDFYCAEAGLVVELDGPVHAMKADEDRQRQDYLVGLGLKVLRFQNGAVTNEIDSVITAISEALQTAGSRGNA